MAKNGYPVLNHLICPRFKGTQMMLQEGRDSFQAVYYCSGEVCPRPLYNEHHHALPHLLYHCRALLLALLVFVP